MADKQAGDNPAEFSLSSLSHHFLYGWTRKLLPRLLLRDRRFLRRQTTLVRGNGANRVWRVLVAQDNHATAVDLWKPHYGKNIDSQALCAIDLRSLPSLPASVRAARMKTSTARGAKMQKIIYLQCFPTPPPLL